MPDMYSVELRTHCLVTVQWAVSIRLAGTSVASNAIGALQVTRSAHIPHGIATKAHELLDKHWAGRIGKIRWYTQGRPQATIKGGGRQPLADPAGRLGGGGRRHPV